MSHRNREKTNSRQRQAIQGVSAIRKYLKNEGTHKSMQNTPRNQNKAVQDTSVQKKSLKNKGTPSKYKNINMDSFCCNKCSFKCKKSETLVRHRLTHIEQSFPILTSYSCNACDKKFRKHSRLEMHKIKTHRKKSLTKNSEKSTSNNIPIKPLEDCEKFLKSHIISQNTSKGHNILEPYKEVYITLDIDYESIENPNNTLNNDNKTILVSQKTLEDCKNLVKPNKKLNITPNNDYKIFHKMDNSSNENESYNTSDDNYESHDDMSDDHKADSHQITEKTTLVHQSMHEDCEKLLVPYQILQNTIKKEYLRKCSPIRKENTSVINNSLENIKGIDKAKRSVLVKNKITDSSKTEAKQLQYKKNTTRTKKRSEIQSKTIQKRKKKQKLDVNKEFICEFCSYKTKKKQVLKAHMVKHSGEQPFTCNHCEFKTNWRNALRKHIMTHTDEKPYACDKCDYRAYQSGNLQRHMKVHSETKKKPLACVINQSDQQKLENQNNTNDIEPYKCEKCTFRTRYPEILEIHSKMHEKQLLICDSCDYKTLSRFRLINHFRKHAKELACSECRFKCKILETLQRHMEIHLPQSQILTSYTCNICNKKFRKQSTFELHQKRHKSKSNAQDARTKVAEFACDVCIYKCKRKYDLVQHKRSHTGEKPYECEFCAYKSATNSHLVVHMRRHTGEKPCICKICGYRCIQISLLQKHMKRMHMGVET